MIVLDGRGLSPDDVDAVSRGATLQVDPVVHRRMKETAALVEGTIIRAKWSLLVGGEPPNNSEDAIRTFVEGHCAGVGADLPKTTVRAAMVARAGVLAHGCTGCRPDALEMIVAMLNADIIPVVPSIGAVGVGGSIPLAHILRVICRYGGEADTPSGRLPAVEAMQGLPAFLPMEKEGLSLLNGSTLTTALGALAVVRARRLLDAGIAACALSFEVMRADTDCLDEGMLRVRNHPGAMSVARRLREQLQGSSLATRGRRPDPFSVRCAPASLGAALEALETVDAVVTRELNGANDNPVVLAETQQVLEGGNFHGAPLALAMDHLKAAVTQLGAMSERRLFRMTYGKLSGLPSFLVHGTGYNSGLMLAQYTAASLVSECKGLSHPASVDSIPTIQHHEDHVSMGPIAAAGALHIVELLEDVVAIELLCAAQGVDFHLEDGESVLGAGTARVHQQVREHVKRWEADRVLHGDLRALGAAVRSGCFQA